jgi:hypothetical protein
LAWRALSAFWRTVEVSSSIEAAVSSSAPACFRCGDDRSLLPAAIWPAAVAIESVPPRTSPTMRRRLSRMLRSAQLELAGLGVVVLEAVDVGVEAAFGDEACQPDGLIQRAADRARQHKAGPIITSAASAAAIGDIALGVEHGGVAGVAGGGRVSLDQLAQRAHALFERAEAQHEGRAAPGARRRVGQRPAPRSVRRSAGRHLRRAAPCPPRRAVRDR